jgi:zinc transporter ZupT
VFLPVIRISPRAQDVMLGFAAGVMLAASAFSLIVPALEASAAIYGGELVAALAVGCGIMLGVVALWLINEHVPHEHFILAVRGRDHAAQFSGRSGGRGRLRHGRPRQGERARDRHRPAEPARGSRGDDAGVPGLGFLCAGSAPGPGDPSSVPAPDPAVRDRDHA